MDKTAVEYCHPNPYRKDDLPHVPVVRCRPGSPTPSSSVPPDLSSRMGTLCLLDQTAPSNKGHKGSGAIEELGATDMIGATDQIGATGV